MKKKIVSVAALVVTCAMCMGAFWGGGDAGAIVKTQQLSPLSLKNTVSATGAVESVDMTRVYSSQAYTVKEINVELGDRVTEGDVLCTLDTDGLTRQLEQQQASMDTSARASRQQVESAQKTLNNFSGGLSNGKNTNLKNLEASLNSAKLSLDAAQSAFDKWGTNLIDNLETQKADTKADQVRDYTGRKDEVQDCQEGVAKAEKELAAANQALEEGIAGDGNLTALEQAVSDAQANLAQRKNYLTLARESYKIAREDYPSVDSDYRTAEKNLNAAKINYNSALEALQAAAISTNQTLDTYSDNLHNAQENSANEVGEVNAKNLREQMDDCTVKAPATGTITAVYAKKGAPGSGLLFVIENTDQLQVSTAIKEYDVMRVKPGMKVEIKSEATDTEAFAGTLSEIAPTAKKNADGSTLSGNNVEFAATVTVDKTDTPLRIGMNTRLSIVLEEKANVYGVSFEAIGEKDGKQVVYTVEQNEKGESVAKAIEVTTGMESDFFVEISGSLSDGMTIISDAAQITDGAKVTVV